MSCQISYFSIYDLCFSDFSAVYTSLHTDDPLLEGHAFSITNKKGNKDNKDNKDYITLFKAQSRLIIGKSLEEIINNLPLLQKDLLSSYHSKKNKDPKIISTVTNTLLSSIWDLWAKKNNKSLWQLLSDFSNEKLLYYSPTFPCSSSNISKKFTTSPENKKENIKRLFKEGIPISWKESPENLLNWNENQHFAFLNFIYSCNSNKQQSYSICSKIALSNYFCSPLIIKNERLFPPDSPGSNCMLLPQVIEKSSHSKASTLMCNPKQNFRNNKTLC